MNRFRADLHNHTLLSPCGDIEMTPAHIVEAALTKGYDIIGITDHNISAFSFTPKIDGIFKSYTVFTIPIERY